MATPLDQLEAVTNDFFLIKDGKAEENYFETSFLLDYFLKQKKGIHKRPSGGQQITIPIRYDGNASGFFTRGGTLDSTKREAITNVNFQWKHCYGNGTILYTDELINAGPEAMINLTTEELIGAQKSIRDTLATSLYNGLDGDTENLTGVNSMCDTTATTSYGGYASNDIVSADGTKVWTGKGSASSTTLTLNNLRVGRTAAAYGQGKQTRPDFCATTETNFDTLSNILSVQQRFTEKDSEPVKAGFQGIRFEGMDIFPDRYCPADNVYLLSSHHTGFAIHKKAMFKRTPWEKIQGSANDKTMKILFSGNFVCNNRRASYRYSNIS